MELASVVHAGGDKQEHDMPMRGELQARSYARQTEGAQQSWVVAALTNRDFQAVVIFALIGLLATIDAVLRFPDFGAVMAQYAQFP
jgi:hypothetical protein